MTREELLKLIKAYHCIDVPLSVCDTLTCEECAEKALTEYENTIYNKALDDLARIVCKYYTLQQRGGYYADTNNMIKQRIADFAEQLKRGVE